MPLAVKRSLVLVVGVWMLSVHPAAAQYALVHQVTTLEEVEDIFGHRVDQFIFIDNDDIYQCKRYWRGHKDYYMLFKNEILEAVLEDPERKWQTAIYYGGTERGPTKLSHLDGFRGLLEPFTFSTPEAHIDLSSVNVKKKARSKEANKQATMMMVSFAPFAPIILAQTGLDAASSNRRVRKFNRYYDKLKLGMIYRDVVHIFGPPDVLLGSAEYAVSVYKKTTYPFSLGFKDMELVWKRKNFNADFAGH